MITQALPGCMGFERRSGIAVHRYAHDRTPFTARAVADGLLRDADVVCLFGVCHDPDARWWQPLLDADMAGGGVRLLKVGSEGDIALRGIPSETYLQLDGVLCQTERIAGEAASVGLPEGFCFPVRNGLPVACWRASLPERDHARRSLRLTTGAFVILGLGRFTQRKRFKHLVRAFAAMVAALPVGNDAPVLVLHGSDFDQHDGEEAEIRQLVSSLSPQVAVRFVSPSVDPRVTLSAADVLVTLAEREGAPNVFIEAFASRCPVVATDLTGHRVYVRDGKEGLLVPVGDHRACVEALIAFHNSPTARRAMSLAAERRAAVFDIAVTAEDYLHAFAATRRAKVSAA